MSNCGTDRKKALEACLANAQRDGKPRYLHFYRGVYWSSYAPPAPTPAAGMYASDYVVVYPSGHYEGYDPKVGPPPDPKTG